MHVTPCRAAEKHLGGTCVLSGLSSAKNAMDERMIVQTLKTVIIVSQATISERACSAARLYRNSG